MDPEKPDAGPESFPIDQLEPHIMNPQLYTATNLNDTTPGSPDMLLESGILDPVAYRRRRLEQLEADLPATTGPENIAALKKRIAELRIDDPVNRRTAQLGAKVLVPYDLNSKQAFVNGEKVHAAGKPWTIEMWMGGWGHRCPQLFRSGNGEDCRGLRSVGGVLAAVSKPDFALQPGSVSPNSAYTL